LVGIQRRAPDQHQGPVALHLAVMVTAVEAAAPAAVWTAAVELPWLLLPLLLLLPLPLPLPAPSQASGRRGRPRGGYRRCGPARVQRGALGRRPSACVTPSPP